jgi:hypothetical protein
VASFLSLGFSIFQENAIKKLPGQRRKGIAHNDMIKRKWHGNFVRYSLSTKIITWIK